MFNVDAGNSNLTVDAVVPVYNGAEFIEAALGSILTQSYPVTNIYVVNDGSTDGTEEILKKIAQSDPRVKIISKKNGGLSSARNAGIKASVSELVAFLDADDIWYPNKIESQIKVYQRSSDPKLGLVYCDYETIDTQGQIIPDKFGSPLDQTVKGDVRAKLIEGNKISSSGSGVLIRRAVFDIVGFFDESLAACEDWDMWLRIAHLYHVDFTIQTLVKIRRHASNMQSDTSRMVYNDFRVLSKYLDDPQLSGNAWRNIYFSLIRHCAPRLILRIWSESKFNPNFKKLMDGIYQKPSLWGMIVCSLVINSNFRKRLIRACFRVKNIFKPKAWFFFGSESPTVTVLMPAYNSARYIEEAITSILRQTLTNFELVIIDAGSTDETLQLADAFNDPRIQIIKAGPGASFSRCIYEGLDVAKAEFVAILSADDASKKNRLERQASKLLSRSDAGLVFSRVEVVSGSGERILSLEKDWHLSPEANYCSLFFRDTISHSSIMFRRSFALKIQTDNLFSFWVKFSEKTAIVQINKALILFRKHQRRFDRDILVKAEEARQQRLQELLNKSLDAQVLVAFKRAYSLRSLPMPHLISFSNELSNIYEALLWSLPSFYKRERAKRYLDEDFSFYKLALEAQGISLPGPGQLNPSFVSRIKGMLHYLARCHGAYWAYFLVRKDHF